MPHTLEIQVTKPKGKSSEYHVRLATPDGHSLAEGDFTYRLDPLSVLTELERLPWEFLHDGDSFIAAGAKTSLARFPLDLDVKLQLPPISGRLRVLCLISSPLDLKDSERLSVELERSGCSMLWTPASGRIGSTSNLRTRPAWPTSKPCWTKS